MSLDTILVFGINAIFNIFAFCFFIVCHPWNVVSVLLPKFIVRCLIYLCLPVTNSRLYCRVRGLLKFVMGIILSLVNRRDGCNNNRGHDIVIDPLTGVEIRVNEHSHKTFDLDLYGNIQGSLRRSPKFKKGRIIDSDFKTISWDSSDARALQSRGLYKRAEVFWLTADIAEAGSLKWIGVIDDIPIAGLQLKNKVTVTIEGLSGKHLFTCKKRRGRGLVFLDQVISHEEFSRKVEMELYRCSASKKQNKAENATPLESAKPATTTAVLKEKFLTYNQERDWVEGDRIVYRRHKSYYKATILRKMGTEEGNIEIIIEFDDPVGDPNFYPTSELPFKLRHGKKISLMKLMANAFIIAETAEKWQQSRSPYKQRSDLRVGNRMGGPSTVSNHSHVPDQDLPNIRTPSRKRCISDRTENLNEKRNKNDVLNSQETDVQVNKICVKAKRKLGNHPGSAEPNPFGSSADLKTSKRHLILKIVDKFHLSKASTARPGKFIPGDFNDKELDHVTTFRGTGGPAEWYGRRKERPRLFEQKLDHERSGDLISSVEQNSQPSHARETTSHPGSSKSASKRFVGEKFPLENGSVLDYQYQNFSNEAKEGSKSQYETEQQKCGFLVGTKVAWYNEYSTGEESCLQGTVMKVTNTSRGVFAFVNFETTAGHEGSSKLDSRWTKNGYEFLVDELLPVETVDTSVTDRQEWPQQQTSLKSKSTKKSKSTQARSVARLSLDENENEDASPLDSRSFYLNEPDEKDLYGYRKGIQGMRNSCYLDSTLFALFYCTTIFDNELLTSAERDDDLAKEVKSYLKTNIVNSLRDSKFVSGETVMKFRKKIGHFNQRLLGSFMDAEDFMYILLEKALKSSYFFTYNNGMSDYVHQIFVPSTNDSSRVSTIQQLYEMSMEYNGDLKLNDIPHPALIIQLPRSNGRLVGFNWIVPSLQLDLSNVMRGWKERRTCLCDEPAKIACSLCADDSVAFCPSCVEQAYLIHEDNQTGHHFTQNNITASTNTKLDLIAVICVANSHYTAYARSGPELLSPWLHFDSSGPEIRRVFEFNTILCAIEKQVNAEEYSNSYPPSIFGRVFTDCHLCIYQPSKSN